MNLPSRRAIAMLIPLLWLVVLASAAGAIFVKHRARELFVELEKVNRERDRLEIEWGQLQLEQSAWSTHAFVENVAASNLGMRTPPPKQIEVVAP
ncbi:MAG: cell division protein FtsL [Gammaproteobacteria bacterium]